MNKVSGSDQIRLYLNAQCRKNLPASYAHFCSINGNSISEGTWRSVVYYWGEEAAKDPHKKQWFEEVRLDRKAAPFNLTEIIFPKRPAKYEEEATQYLNHQCDRNLPATQYHFRKSCKVRINRRDFNVHVQRWQLDNALDPAKKKWFDTVRLSREGLSVDEAKEYFPKQPQVQHYSREVRDYISNQCNQNLPATCAHFCKTRGIDITTMYFGNCLKTWKEIYTDNPKKMHWFHSVRKNKRMAPAGEKEDYFPVTVKDTGAKQVRDYLALQCNNKLPATWPHFAATHPKTKVIQPEFSTQVAKWGKNAAEDPEKKHWFDTIRQCKANLTNEQKQMYFPSKHNEESLQGLVRQYLDDQFAEGLPVTWDGYQADHPDSQITHEQYKDGTRSWRKKNKDDPAKMDWFENTRLNPEGLPVETKEKFFPQNVSNPDDVQTVVDFVEECYKGGRPASLTSFHGRYDTIPDYTYKNGEREWGRQHHDDPRAMTWFREVRTQEARFAAQVGKWFDKAVNADLYGALRDRQIPYYHQTTGFAALGVHPREPRRKEDYRVEGRVLVKDLLAFGSGIGPALRKFLEELKRPELMIDVTLSGYVGKKIGKYVDNASVLLVITPGGMGGQRLLETHTRVLSMAEFTGKEWFNLQPEMAKSLNDDLYLARAALWGGPTSQAYKDWCARADAKWERIKPELHARAAQDQYERRVHGEIVRSLRQGTMPKELEAYIDTARDAGHADHADRLDLMARAMAALGRELHRTDARNEVTEDKWEVHEQSDRKNLEDSFNERSKTEELRGREGPRGGHFRG